VSPEIVVAFAIVDAGPGIPIHSSVPAKPSALVDTRVIYCGDNLDQPTVVARQSEYLMEDSKR